MDVYGLQNNDWVQSMHKRWAKTFLKDKLFAGMISTQCYEGMNWYMNIYLNKKLKLFEFVEQFDKGLQWLHHGE